MAIRPPLQSLSSPGPLCGSQQHNQELIPSTVFMLQTCLTVRAEYAGEAHEVIFQNNTNNEMIGSDEHSLVIYPVGFQLAQCRE